MFSEISPLLPISHRATKLIRNSLKFSVPKLDSSDAPPGGVSEDLIVDLKSVVETELKGPPREGMEGHTAEAANSGGK